MKTLTDHFVRNKPFYRACLDSLAGLAFFAMLGLFCWLCCAASGYHWE